MDKRTWLRGALALAVLGGLVAALIASPVGAFERGDKQKVKKISKNQATNVVNQLAPGIATAAATTVANPLASRIAFARDDADALVGTNGTVLATAIIAPTNGHLAINAGSEVHSDAPDSVHCILNVDGTDLPSTRRVTGLQEDEDCTTEGAVAVTAGTHVVQFNAVSVDEPLTTFDESVLWVMFVPFDGGGSLPTGPSLG